MGSQAASPTCQVLARLPIPRPPPVFATPALLPPTRARATCRSTLQIPLYAAYALTTNVLLPWWRQPKLDDMPETGECRGRLLRKRCGCLRLGPLVAVRELTVGHTAVSPGRCEEWVVGEAAGTTAAMAGECGVLNSPCLPIPRPCLPG